MKLRRWLMFGIALLLSLGGLYLLLKDLDIKRLQAMLNLVDYHLFGLSLLIAVVSQLLPPLRWRVLLDRAASYWHCTSALLISNLVSALVPFRLGEVVRTGLIRRSDGIGVATSVVTIIAGYILDVLSLLLLGLGLLLIVPLPSELLKASIILITLIVIGSGCVAIGWRLWPDTATLDRRLANNTGYQKNRTVVERIIPSLMILRDPLCLAQVTGLSLGFWIMTAFANFFLLIGLVRSDMSTIILLGVMLTFTAGIGRLLPALPGSIGTVDAAVLLGLTSLGISYDEAVALVLLLRLRYTLMTALTGIFGLGLQLLDETKKSAYLVSD